MGVGMSEKVELFGHPNGSIINRMLSIGRERLAGTSIWNYTFINSTGPFKPKNHMVTIFTRINERLKSGHEF
jgi:hypothetical protein